MTKERLLGLSDEIIRELARKEGVHFSPETGREELVEQIIEALDEDRVDREVLNNLAMRIKEKKYEVVQDEDIFISDDNEYPIPQSYNETKIFLMLRDPYWAFCYWEIFPSEAAEIKRSEGLTELFLRVYTLPDGELTIKSFSDYFDIPVSLSDDCWYINLPQSGIRYCIDLVSITKGSIKRLCRSNIISSPRGDVQEEMKSADNPLLETLFLSGLFDVNIADEKDEIPQRIISLIDSQYVHLTN
ncbi:DUF4912 domain-containing protein [Marispirochaeta aestuarii]|uniref:DUF4912 domain-containing protein n=1 Tax=Marispirochaeta aestuarii TaxID=1963862 RepID=A0A1Y1RW47_9SPIO|nr:DUF4912 domain-containing protein [Marispirochaeta aestuarii]ORC34300.1 hypothetical protein B4O97_13385 [Marispirochaeta aestuarii]